MENKLRKMRAENEELRAEMEAVTTSSRTNNTDVSIINHSLGSVLLEAGQRPHCQTQQVGE